jgi:hypothetical protein
MMTQDVKLFLPVKILDKQWADKLLKGSIFMRSLYEFGKWNLDDKFKNQTEEMDNTFRGDINEGIVRIVDPQIGDPFFNGIFPPEVRKFIPSMWYIDENFYKYLKIYSMYSLTYNTNQNQFEQPDEMLKNFGDTAVIIYYPDEFIRRIHKGLYDRFRDNINFKIRQVFYYNLFKDFGNFDIFWKEKMYEWQKEVRITVGLLDGQEIRIDEHGRRLKALIKSIEPLILEIGNIEDIAVAIPTEDLINLKLPAEIITPD